MSIQSQAAIRKCLQFLHIDPAAKESTRVHATIDIPKYSKRGSITVDFHPDRGEGPYLSLDHTIRGYGIKFEEFKPGRVRMRFDKRNGVLRLSHDDYEFVLEFGEQAGA